jgi:hypothetical protein
LTAFGRLKSSEDGYHVTPACTIRKIGRTCEEVNTSYGTRNIVKSLVANDEKVFKILTFRNYQKIVKLKVSQLETMGKIREWDEFGWDTSDRVQAPKSSSKFDLAG